MGYCGEEQPRHTIPSPPQLDHATAPPATKTQWRTLLTPFLRHLYFHLLLISPRDRRLVVIEPPFLPTRYKLALLSCVHVLDVPAVMFVPSLSLPLLLSPSPLTAGLMVDIGRYESRVVAVWQGVVVMETMETVPGGMAAVGRELLRLVADDDRNAGVRQRLVSEVDDRQLEELVAKVVYVAADEQDEQRQQGSGKDVVYDIVPLASSYLHFSSSSFLPTQEALLSVFPQTSLRSPATSASSASSSSFPVFPRLSVTVPASARAAAASTLFGNNPDSFSLVSAILAHLRTLPLDARAAVLSNILIAGGGSELPGIHASLHVSLVSALSTLPTSAAQDCSSMSGGLSSALAGSVAVREVVAGVGGSLLGWVGASVMRAVLVESEEEWMGRDEMALYIDGSSSSSGSDSNRVSGTKQEEET